MIEEYNRVVRLKPMTYHDALKLCYDMLGEKIKEVDKLDTHEQGLSNDYKTAQLLLEQLYLHRPEDITHNKYEKEI